MNKYKKAFTTLTDWFHSYTDSNGVRIHERHITESYEEAKKKIGELVEKATPKKPIEYPSFASGYKCPNCESNIVLHGSHEICPTPCCSWCGQALDWSKEDVD